MQDNGLSLIVPGRPAHNGLVAQIEEPNLNWVAFIELTPQAFDELARNCDNKTVTESIFRLLRRSV